MKKALFCLLCVVSLAFFAESLFADCGKMVIYRRTVRYRIVDMKTVVPPAPPVFVLPPTPVVSNIEKQNYIDYGQGNTILAKQMADLLAAVKQSIDTKQTQGDNIVIGHGNSVSPSLENVSSSQGSNTQKPIMNSADNTVEQKIEKGQGGVNLPPPAGGDVRYGDRTFEERSQKALIAWNGYDNEAGIETLILSTDEVATENAPQAMLSVLPLPGKPISVERANLQAFIKAGILFDKKLVAKGQESSYGVVYTTKIGSHNIFVWEIEDIATFREKVESYIGAKYGNEAAVLITEHTENVIKYYFDKGFKYFAFDLTLVDNEIKTKEAIAYTFRTSYAFFPMAISAIGGSGRSVIELLVMTPDEIALSKEFEKELKDTDTKLTIVGNTSVYFDMDEVKSIDECLFKPFENENLKQVKARKFMIPLNDIAKFAADFEAVK